MTCWICEEYHCENFFLEGVICTITFLLIEVFVEDDFMRCLSGSFTNWKKLDPYQNNCVSRRTHAHDKNEKKNHINNRRSTRSSWSCLFSSRGDHRAYPYTIQIWGFDKIIYLGPEKKTIKWSQQHFCYYKSGTLKCSTSSKIRKNDEIHEKIVAARATPNSPSQLIETEGVPLWRAQPPKKIIIFSIDP